MEVSTGYRSEIVFFDLEVTRPEEGSVIVEFGATLVDPRTLVEYGSFSTLIRPPKQTHTSSLVDRCSGITKDALASAPTFAHIADTVYNLLHGRIWAGHNILRFDCDHIREAFAEINRPAPEPKGIIDSLQLLTQTFKNRTDNMQLATLAKYFGLGKQKRRSLDDIRMNIEVLKCCGGVLLLESSLPDNNGIFSKTRDFLEPHDVSIPYISVTRELDGFGSQKTQILHRNVSLKLSCGHLNIRFGISIIVNDFGQERLSFVVDPSPSLCKILDACDHHAYELFRHSGSSSKWLPVVIRKEGFNSPTLRLRLPTVKDGEVTRLDTEIYQKDSSGSLSRFDVTYRLESLFIPGNPVDAYFSLHTYDYRQKAGIRLVAEMLILHI
ncbi:hypothetical protein CDL12_03433 [Handroanthus impetiginosus]|uniref:Exonuclease domain-containing protein n=1 Tax=Handroanthus impetiginosus TaxID=429701 RepID=A0A2G9I244_9LAMI|nr:hypothetical protein CDL12_03433 [Handroanthus impetiginosus]